jgi:hypothetical protein
VESPFIQALYDMAFSGANGARVKFEFFHRLDEVTVNWDDENHPYVEELKFEQRAALKSTKITR